jgi:hypothetical protein
MAQATVARPTRSDKALGILERHEVIPANDMPGWWHVRDSLTGSGKWYLATAAHCNCYDAQRHICKHMQAVQRESRLLEAYSASWDAWAASQRPCCPQCGAQLVSMQFYVGGRGYRFFDVCSGDRAHYCTPA